MTAYRGDVVMEKLSVEQISLIYSYLGYLCISEGNVKAIKALYGHSCYEEPPLIETINLLQLHLTAAEIHYDTKKKYSDEFLYYWGMICLGETSRLIVRNLATSKACFNRIEKAVPKAEARLAFIELLKSTEPHKCDNNTRRLYILQKWARTQDAFSKIVLAKIVYDSYLREEDMDVHKLPTLALDLLGRPCKMGHPVAVKFNNAILDNLAGVGITEAFDRRIGNSRTNINMLYDF